MLRARRVTRRLISTGSPFEAAIGYSRAVIQDTVEGRWCFVSGTTGYDYQAMTMPEDPTEQTRNALATIEAILQEANLALADVHRARYILSDRADRDAVASALSHVFQDIRPAATMIVAALIQPEMKVEIEVDAFRAVRAR